MKMPRLKKAMQIWKLSNCKPVFVDSFPSLRNAVLWEEMSKDTVFCVHASSQVYCSGVSFYNFFGLKVS